MIRERKHRVGMLLLCGLLALSAAPRAEIVDEVVAWVNGDIITWSELESEEQSLIQEAYRSLTGEKLDREVAAIRKGLLLRMIDRKVLLDRAPRFADMDKLGDFFYEQFKAQQNVEDDEEFERMLERDGLTVETVKERLIEMFGPEEVKRMEVGGRIAVGDAAVEEFYEQNQEKFIRAGEVTIREIVLLVDNQSAREARRADAAAVRERALAEDFAALAEEVSEAGTRGTGGLLGPLKRTDLSQQLEEVAFQLPVGGVSEVLDMPYGFHIVKVESRIDDGLVPLDDVREVVRNRLADQKYAAELEVFMEKARAEAEWCVKPRFRERLSVPSPECVTF